MKRTVVILSGVMVATASLAEVITLKTGNTLTGEVSRVGKSIVEVRSGNSTSYHSLSDLKPDDAKRIAPEFEPSGNAPARQVRKPSSAARQSAARAQPAAGNKAPDAQYRLAFRDKDENALLALLEKYPNLIGERGYHDVALCEAISNGMNRVVQKLVASGADVNVPGGGGRTPLHMACVVGDAEIASLLIEKGALVSAADSKSNQPLHEAAKAGQAAVVRLLIEKGTDVHAQGDYERTPLHLAARAGSIEVAEILLAGGADINARSYENEAPLHLAAEGGHAEMIRFLLSHDAYLGILSRGNGTALHYAAATGSLTAAEALIGAGLGVNDQDVSGRTPLHYAVEQNALELTAFLLEKGSKTELYGRGYGIHDAARVLRTPLHVAARFSRPAIVKMLLEHGADPNALDSVGATPLHEAAAAMRAVNAGRAEEKLETVRMLAAVSDVNAANDAGETPLICLAQRRDPHSDKTADTLIARGADVNFEDRTGRTALHHAFAEGHATLIHRLTAVGADEGRRDFEGRKPQDYEVSRAARRPPARVARDIDADEMSLHEAAEKRDKYLVQHLLARGADVNEKDAAGRTPLHRAIRRDGVNRDDIEQILLKAGADPKITNWAGQTPLHAAVNMLSVMKVEALIAGEAPVNAQDRNGDTALHLAASQGKWDMAAALLKAKADPNLKNREGNTALHLASGGRNPEKGIPMLLQHGADRGLVNATGLTPAAYARAKGIEKAIKEWEKAGMAP